jgi:hypothetical protein
MIVMVMATAILLVQTGGGVAQEATAMMSKNERAWAAARRAQQIWQNLIIKNVFSLQRILQQLNVYTLIKKGAKGKNIQVKKVAYAMIIDEDSLMFQIEREEFNLHKIRQRMYTDFCLQVSHLGPMSRMEDIDSHLVVIIIQLRNMKQPLSTS